MVSKYLNLLQSYSAGFNLKKKLLTNYFIKRISFIAQTRYRATANKLMHTTLQILL